MSKLPTRDEFVEQKGTIFELELTPEESIDIELIDVDEVKEMPPYQSFAVVFLAPPEIEPATQIFKLKHEKMGEIEIFLSPFSKDDTGLKLESVFNVLAED